VDSSVSLEISTVLNYTYKVNFEYLLKIWYQLISKNSGIEPVIYRSVSKNSGIEPVIYRSVSKNSDIEPALLLLHTVLLLGTVFYVKIRLNYNVSIEYRTKFRYRSVSNKTWYRTSTSHNSLCINVNHLILETPFVNGNRRLCARENICLSHD
jgi:hypothetical protein